VHIYVSIYHTKSLHIKGTFENVYIYIRPGRIRETYVIEGNVSYHYPLPPGPSPRPAPPRPSRPAWHSPRHFYALDVCVTVPLVKGTSIGRDGLLGRLSLAVEDLEYEGGKPKSVPYYIYSIKSH
jgi:hypothetical protein